MRSKGLRFFVLMVGLFIFIALADAAVAAEKVPGVTDTSIKVGVIHFLTGPISYLGKESINALDMYLEEVNKAGGINGRKIETVVDDDPCQVAKAIGAFKRLVDSVEVFSVLSGQCSNSSVSMIPLINEAKVPTIFFDNTAPKLTNPVSPYIFRTGFMSDQEMMPATADFVVKELKAKKIAYMRYTGEWGLGGTQLFTQRLEKYGLKPVADEVFNFGDTDFTSQLFRLKNADPDVILIWVFAKEGAIILRQAKEQGVKAQWVAHGLSSGQFLPLVKESGVGLMGIYLGIDLEEAPKIPAVVDFIKKYEARYPVRQPGTPDYAAMQAYSAAQVFVEALKRAGKDLTREKFIEALESLKNFGTGTNVPITFSKTEHQGIKEARIFKIVAPDKRELLPAAIKMAE